MTTLLPTLGPTPPHPQVFLPEDICICFPSPAHPALLFLLVQVSEDSHPKDRLLSLLLIISDFHSSDHKLWLHIHGLGVSLLPTKQHTPAL